FAQLVASLLFVVFGFLEKPVFALICLLWCCFCAGLGLRGPTLMAKSLSSAGSHSGQASGLLMFLAFGLSSAATAAVAPFLAHGLLPAACFLLGMTLLSTLLGNLTNQVKQ